jgi:hypothetical protein
MQAHVLVQRQELAHPLGLMRGEVVEDDVDLLMIGMLGHHRAEKSDELFAGVTGCGLADDLTGLAIEGGIKRESSASDVLERSLVEVKTPRLIMSRSILLNQSSTWLSQEE